MHFHIAQTGVIYGEFIFAFRRSQEKKLAPIQNLYLGYKVGQIRSCGSWFGAKIGLFMMFVCFHLIYKTFINILEYANEVISYTTTRWKDM